jgi:thiamin-phosphate kinase
MARESQLVEKIARGLSSGKRGTSLLRLGIGDDAAVLSPARATEWVLSCDAFLEHVHFEAKSHPPDSVGYKAVARATSDLAAMGATPRFFLLTLALPARAARTSGFPTSAAMRFAKTSSPLKSHSLASHSAAGWSSPGQGSADRSLVDGSFAGQSSADQSFVGRGFSHDKTSARGSGASAPEAPSEAWLNAFLKGMARASRELGISIIGGDTTKSDRIFISITVLGEISPGRALTRSGARPGDIIYVSGKLGRAQLGLELVLRGQARNRQLRALVQPHLYPKIHIELGAWLARHQIATSAMDLSDGLSTDLARLCIASKVGAKIYASQVPSVSIPPAAARELGLHKLDPLQLALHGGEDYQLLFTISPRQAKKLNRAPGAAALTAIGEITRSRQVLLVAPDGKTKPLKSQGWDPFRVS